jgi:hypothetical protein
MKRRPAKAAAGDGWRTIASLALMRTVGERRLQIMCAPSAGTEWLIVALETSSSATSLDEVAGAHSHETLGSVQSMKDAIAKADAYADEWSRAAQLLEACACGEIGSAP